jgi:hypothetical protein
LWGFRVMACLLKNEPASCCCVARLTRGGGAVAKASPNRAKTVSLWGGVSRVVQTRSGVIYPWPG